MYKQATQLGLRFQTNKGLLSTEQLFHISQTDLAAAIKVSKKALKKNDDDDLGFLETNSKVDKIEELRFNILKDVYLTKKAEADALRDAAATKAHNEKIDALILKKQESQLEEMSIEDLEKLRKP